MVKAPLQLRKLSFDDYSEIISYNLLFLIIVGCYYDGITALLVLIPVLPLAVGAPFAGFYLGSLRRLSTVTCWLIRMPALIYMVAAVVVALTLMHDEASFLPLRNIYTIIFLFLMPSVFVLLRNWAGTAELGHLIFDEQQGTSA